MNVTGEVGSAGGAGSGGSKGQVTAAPPAFAQSGSAVAIPPVPESAIVIVVPSDEIVTWSSLASPVMFSELPNALGE